MAVGSSKAQPAVTDLLFGKAGVGLCLVAPDDTVVRANAEWLRSTGYTEEQVVGESILDLFAATREVLALHARARAGHRVDVPRHAQTVNGRETWWEGSIDPVATEGGTGLLITAREVTVLGGEARNEERDGRRAADLLEATLASMTQGVMVFDSGGAILRINSAAERILGISQAELAQAKGVDGRVALFNLRRADGSPFPVQETPSWKALHGEVSREEELLLQRPTGEAIWVCASGASLRGAGGALNGAVVTFSDVTGQKHALQALRENELKYRSLFENSLDAIYVTRGEVILDVNTAACRMHGMTVQEIRQRGRAGAIVADERYAEAVKQREATGQTRAELTCLRKDGATFPVEVASVTVEQTRQDWTTFSIVREITDRKRTEEELATASRLYAVLSRVNEAIVRTRAEQPLYEEICRIVAEEGKFPLVWVGLVEARTIIPAASWGTAAAYLPEIRVEMDGDLGRGPTGTCVREDRPVINDDFGTNPATWPWREATARHGLRASAAFPLHQGGAVVGALTLYAGRPGAFTARQVELLEALCADISYALDAMRAERLRAEAENAQRESDERFRAAFEASPDAININRLRDGVYVMINDGFTRLSGWARQEVVGKTAADLRIWADPAQRGRMIEGLTQGDSTQNIETTFRRKDGSVFDAWLSVRTFEAGGERFLLAITRDISDLKRAEAALREAGRRKDEFLGMLSHELRNPLAPIRNSTYILQYAEPGSGEARRAQAVIERQTGHLARIVDDLLDVTRVARGKIELRRARMNLCDVVCRAADDYRFVLKDRGVGFQVTVPDVAIWIEGDATRITQVIGNLLQNASKFTHRGEEVTLLLERGGHDAAIRVRDTGAGIAPELLPRIFDPFVQGDRTLARTEGGLGLGLALVKGITELHGGTVRADSAGDGKGAEFTVRLPLPTPNVFEAAPEALPERSRTGTRRVLVVDDNADAAESLAEILRMLGHRVEVAFDGPTAIEKARMNPPDAVLCDLGLPGMSGYEVAQALRAHAADRMQLIAVSGYAQHEDARRAIEAGFDAHVAKPTDPRKLEQLLA
jgi:PAS domain S-box-containing protein